jgi:uncharacterized membrane protein
MTDLHPSVADYLARFDAAAAGLPADRRAELRREIVDHLSAAIPVGATEAEADQVLATFGSPTEIIEQARDAADAEPIGSRQSRLRFLAVGAVIIVVVALFLSTVLPLALAVFGR